MEKTPATLRARALRLLSMRDYSRRELQRKLAEHEVESGSLLRLLDQLEAQGLVNDERVLESLLHSRASRFGSKRLQQDLLTKGLPAAAVSAAVSELQGSELARAKAVWQKRFGAAPGNLRERARQSRFLATRGFSGDIIRQVLGLPADEWPS